MGRGFFTASIPSYAIIARANEKGHLVIYNHPIWSLQNYNDYVPLKGLWGMELCNYSSVVAGYEELHNSVIYRDMVNHQGSIVPVGADDAHSTKDACGAWIMVGAEKLEYGSVIEAMEKGHIYASTGPEIHSLTWDGQFLDIACSDARSISVECGNRYARYAAPLHNDGLMREARFDMRFWLDRCTGHPFDWLRIIVHGPYGHYASTRAFTYEELT